MSGNGIISRNGYLPIRRFFSSVLAVSFVISGYFEIAPIKVQAASAIGSITVSGKAPTNYSTLKDLAKALKDMEGKTIVIDMFSDWISTGDEKDDKNQRLYLPEDSNVTFNMHGHIFDRNNVDDNRDSTDGELIYVDCGTTLTINGHSTDEEKYTVHDQVYVFTDTDQETAESRISLTGGVLAGGEGNCGTGGIYIDAGKDVIINDVTIAGCKAEYDALSSAWHSGYGGGIIITESNTNLVLKNSRITGCLAEEDGGGIYQTDDNDVTIELINSSIDHNYANSDGGGINMDGESLTIKASQGSSISSNKTNGYGGGVYFWNDESTLRANTKGGLTLDGNTAQRGGGIYAMEEDIKLENLIITNNRSTEMGGGVYFNNDYTTLSNCTITGNNKYGVYIPTDCDKGVSISGSTVIKDNTDGNLTLEDGDSYILFDQNESADIHIGYVDLPDSADGYDITRDPSIDVSNQFTADNAGYIVAFTYRDTDQDNGRRLRYIRESDQSDERGRHRVNPDVQEVATQNIHAYLEPTYDENTIYAGGYTAAEGGSGTRYQLRRLFSHHTSGGDRDFQLYYTDGFFFEDPIIYNDHLATASYGLATSGMYLDSYDYNYKHAGARQFMADIGCPDQMIYVNDSNASKPGTDTIGVTIGSKVLQELSGDEYDFRTVQDTEYTLIAISVRGANYGAEWASNVTLGDGSTRDGEAQGFSEAADQVMEAVDFYISRYGLQGKIEEGKVKFWIAGFSRAGAASNITAKRLIETYCADTGTETIVATGNEVFAYPCEAPQGGTDNAEKLSDKTAYYSIHNLVNAGDLVPYVGPQDMGFKRYGVDHFIPGTHFTRMTRDEYVEKVRGITYHNPDQASEESGITTVTVYHDNEYLDTKKTMDSETTDKYNEYVRRRDNMVRHLATINHTIMFNDYFHPWATSADVPPWKKKGDFDGAKLEDYLPNLLSYIQQQTGTNRHNYALNITHHGRDTETIQDVARAYFAADSGDKKAFEALVDAYSGLFSGLWDEISLVNKIRHWREDSWTTEEYRRKIIDDLWTQADGKKAFDGLTEDQKKELKKHWFTLTATVFDLAGSDWHLGDGGKGVIGIPVYPTGTQWVNGDVSSVFDYWIADRMVYLLTAFQNISNIININHDKEVATAWTMTYDSYYSNPETGEMKGYYEEYKTHWVNESDNPDSYTVEAPSALIRNNDPEAQDPYTQLKATPAGSDPVYNDVGNAERVYLEVGMIHDNVSPADVTQGNGDVLGEAIYYTVANVTDGDVDISIDKDMGELTPMHLYRGGVDLPLPSEEDCVYKIVARAKSLGAPSDMVIYYVAVGSHHKVTVDNGSGQSPVTSYPKSGEELTITASPAEGKHFVSWKVKLLDAEEKTVEEDIARSILNGNQNKSSVTFTIPESGAEYKPSEAVTKHYPNKYGLEITAQCADRITGITPSSVESGTSIVPVAGSATDPKVLAGTADLTFAIGSDSWKSPNNPYPISWSYKYEEYVCPAAPGDKIYGKSVYTATITAPMDKEKGILFDSNLKAYPSEELKDNVTSITAVRNEEDGSATVTIVFKETGEGEYPEPARIPLKMRGISTANPQTPVQELGELGYVRQGDILTVTARNWPGYRFREWVFNEKYCDPYVQPKDTSPDLENKNISLKIKNEIPTDHGDLYVYAKYEPVVTEIAASLSAPRGGLRMQMKPGPSDDAHSQTIRIRMMDEWYLLEPSFINTTPGTGNGRIIWSPEPLIGYLDRKAAYLTAYTATLQIVPRQDDKGSYVMLKKDGTDEFIRMAFSFNYSEDLTVTMNHETAAFDRDSSTITFTFPTTTAVLEKVIQPSDVTGIPYGTEGDALKPYLPETVALQLEHGRMIRVEVNWSEPHKSLGELDPYNRQLWIASSEVQLPFGVLNPHKVPLGVVIRLWVDPADMVRTPVPSVEPGTYWSDKKLTLSCETEGASIYWTTSLDATDVLENVPGDPAWNLFDGSMIEINRKDATEDEIGPDGQPTGRKQITLRTAAFKEGMRPNGIHKCVYVFANEVEVPEGHDYSYAGRPLIGVKNGPYYELNPLTKGASLNRDGDVIAVDPGTYEVKAKIAAGFQWIIRDPETGEISYTTRDQIVTFTITRDKWVIFYDANGGTKAPASQTMTVPEDAVITSEQPVHGALAFKGWAEDPDAEAPEYQPGDVMRYTEGKNRVILYALWELSPVIRPVRITYNANGVDSAKVPAPVWIEKDKPLELGAAAAPFGSFRIFRGWSSNPSAAEPEYHAGDSVPFEQDTTLYAIWEIDDTWHRVTVDNGSGIGPAVKHHKSGDTVTITAMPADTKFFTKWTVKLLDAGGNKVEEDIAEAILNESQTQELVTFVMPESGAQYAEGKTYPVGYSLEITAVCNDRIMVITPSSVEGGPSIVPVARTVEEPDVPAETTEESNTPVETTEESSTLIETIEESNTLAGTANLTFQSGVREWDSTDNPYAISWSYHTASDVTKEYPASGGDVIYGHCIYTARIKAPKNKEEAIIFCSTLTVAPSPEMEDTYTELTAVRDDADGSATVTIVFKETGDGPQPPAADIQLNVQAFDVNLNDYIPGAGVTYHVLQGQTVEISAPSVADERFSIWDFDDTGITPAQGYKLTDRTLKIVIPSGLTVDELNIRAKYIPVVSAITAVIAPPVPERNMQVQPDAETLKVKISDVYEINPGNVAISWSPAPKDGKAEYLTVYTATIRIVPDQSSGQIRVRKEGETEYVPVSGTFIYSEGVTATINREAAFLDQQNNSISYTFPMTKYTLEEVYPPEDVTGIPYGTEGDNLRPYLPLIKIRLNNDETMMVTAAWGEPKKTTGELDPYDQQLWEADGIVELPFTVENPKEIPLNVHAKLYVDAADPVKEVIPSVKPGTYWDNKKLRLSTRTEGASIYWTTDPNASTDPDVIPKDWKPYDGTWIEIRREDAAEDEIGPDGKPTGRKQITLRTYAFKEGMRPDKVRSFVYVFANEVSVPEGIDRKYSGEAVIGVYGGTNYTLEALSEGVTINEDGNAVATEAGIYMVNAKIADMYRWEIIDPETREKTYTTDDQIITFSIYKDNWVIEYNANGGTKAPESQIIPVPKDAVISTELPENGAMYFRGWALDPSAAQPEYQPGSTLPYTEGTYKVVLYALWQLSPVERPVIISFNVNGGLEGTEPAPLSVKKGNECVLPEQTPSWDPQHDFLGWARNPAANVPEWNKGSTVRFEQDTTLYAVWRPHYNVTQGAGSSWTKGSGADKLFAANGKLQYFQKILMDNKDVTGSAGISASEFNGTIAVFSSDFMQKLSVGKHTVIFVYFDGEASAEFTVRNPGPDPQPTPAPQPVPVDPNTRDGTNTESWAMILLVSILTSISSMYVLIKDRKR